MYTHTHTHTAQHTHTHTHTHTLHNTHTHTIQHTHIRQLLCPLPGTISCASGAKHTGGPGQGGWSRKGSGSFPRASCRGPGVSPPTCGASCCAAPPDSTYSSPPCPNPCPSRVVRGHALQWGGTHVTRRLNPICFLNLFKFRTSLTRLHKRLPHTKL